MFYTPSKLSNAMLQLLDIYIYIYIYIDWVSLIDLIFLIKKIPFTGYNLLNVSSGDWSFVSFRHVKWAWKALPWSLSEIDKNNFSQEFDSNWIFYKVTNFSSTSRGKRINFQISKVVHVRSTHSHSNSTNITHTQTFY